MSPWEQLLKHKFFSSRVVSFWLKLLAVSFFIHFVGLLFLLVSRKEKIVFNISTTHMLFNCPVKVNQLKKTVAKTTTKSVASKPKKATPKQLSKPFDKQVAQGERAMKSNSLQSKKTEPVKKTETAKKEIEKKVEHPVKQEAKKIPEAKPKEEPKEQSKSSNAKAEKALEIGRKDMENLKLFEKVYSSVSKNFKPPKGIATGVECAIKLSLDKKGSIKNLEFEKSSNILIFDLSAKRAVLDSAIPKELWGKDITLNFKAD